MHRNMLTIQRDALIKARLSELDKEIAELHAEEYMVDADRRLDERLELAERREAYVRGECDRDGEVS